MTARRAQSRLLRIDRCNSLTSPGSSHINLAGTATRNMLPDPGSASIQFHSFTGCMTTIPWKPERAEVDSKRFHRVEAPFVVINRIARAEKLKRKGAKSQSAVSGDQQKRNSCRVAELHSLGLHICIFPLRPSRLCVFAFCVMHAVSPVNFAVAFCDLFELRLHRVVFHE